MASIEAESGRLDPSLIRPWSEVKKGYTKFEEGDVLFAKITPSMENGKAALATGLFNGRGVGSTEFHVLRPGGEINARYLLHFVLQSSTRRAARAQMRGVAGQLRVPPEFFNDLEIPLPPLDEQRQIVAEIETQFARLDDAVAALKRARTRLKRYRASVLKAACEGRLVPTEAELARQEGREYEPASVLLARIKAERKATPGTGRGKAKAAPAPDTSGMPELPEGWTWSVLGSLIREPLRNGHSSKVSPDGMGVPTISITAVTVGDFSPRNVKMTTADPNKVTDLWLKPGDIYIQRSNTADLVGTARLFLGPENFAIFPDLLIRVRLSADIDERFIESVLHSAHTRHYFKAKAQGISGTMPKISQETIESLPVPVAPNDEQRRIVSEVERVTSVIEQIEATVETNLKRAESLRQSILRMAFCGRLVAGVHSEEVSS